MRGAEVTGGINSPKVTCGKGIKLNWYHVTEQEVISSYYIYFLNEYF